MIRLLRRQVKEEKKKKKKKKTKKQGNGEMENKALSTSSY
jgi:hypothetical protein